MFEERKCIWCRLIIAEGIRSKIHKICSKRKYNYNNKIKSVEYYNNNKEKISETQKIYYNKNKKKIDKYKRNWAKENHDKVKDSALKYARKNKDRHRKYKNTRKVLDRKKNNARYLVQKNIPMKNKCEICNKGEELERHHWNYDKPLLVNTLCRTCHSIQHIKNYKNSIYGEIL